MARYSVDFQRTASLTLSVGSLGANATRPRRGKVYDLILGSEAAAADNPFLWTVQRCTAQGTATAVVPQPLDPADAATEATAAENHTVEPTYTAAAIVLNIPLNQRATFRWQQDPAYGLVYPATAANGFGLQTDVGSVVVVTATLHFEEQ